MGDVMQTKPKQFILYDGRACGGIGTDDAQVLCCASTIEEARSDSKIFGDGAIYSYDMDYSKKPPEAINEQWVEDFGNAD